jgi:hypothetical protein
MYLAECVLPQFARSCELKRPVSGLSSGLAQATVKGTTCKKSWLSQYANKIYIVNLPFSAATVFFIEGYRRLE